MRSERSAKNRLQSRENKKIENAAHRNVNDQKWRERSAVLPPKISGEGIDLLEKGEGSVKERRRKKTKKRGVQFIIDSFPILPFDVPPYGGARIRSHARVKQRVRWKYCYR